MAGRPRLSDEEKASRAIAREERRKQQSWVDEVAKLPASSNPSSELEWIRNPPAMGRLDRIRDRDKSTRVILEIEDIRPVHGEAPSKAAVSMLQHWCNRPDEFYKNLLAEQKKATKIKDDGSIVDDIEKTPEVRDIDVLLASLDSSKKD